MLEFAERSPHVRDVSLSDGGELILRNPLTSQEAMRGYGRLALFQIIGAFHNVSSSYTFQTRIGSIQQHVYGLAKEVMDDPRTSNGVGPFYSRGGSPWAQHANIHDFGEGLGMARHGRGDIDENYTGLVIVHVEHTRELVKPKMVAA